LGLAVMLMGWSGPGSFMVSPFFGQFVVIEIAGLDTEYSATARDAEGASG
jgi:hypothetical protein